jgi:hypothetical protein
MSEEIIKVVKSYKVGKEPDSIVAVLPKETAPKPGTRYLVKKDSRGRLIYEPLQAENAETESH